jgi:hypothetical protein
MLATYFGCFPHFWQDRATGFSTDTVFSILHTLPGKS